MSAETTPTEPGTAASTTAVAPPPAGPLREVWIIARAEFRYLAISLRTLIPVLIYGGVAALLLWGYIAGADKIHDDILGKQADATPEAIEKATQDGLAWVLETTRWGTRGDAAEILRDKVPLILLYFFFAASYFLPLLISIVTFDQFSELSTRGARFVLLRVRRGTYFAGKALAGAAAVPCFLLLMWLMVVALTIYRDGASAAPRAMTEALRNWALMSVLALPYLSLTAFISSLVRPLVAFLMTVAALIVLLIGSWCVDSAIPWMLKRTGWEGAIEAERHLLAVFPWTHMHKLISRDTLTLVNGVGSLLILAAIGYTATYLVIRRRDV